VNPQTVPTVRTSDPGTCAPMSPASPMAACAEPATRTAAATAAGAAAVAMSPEQVLELLRVV